MSKKQNVVSSFNYAFQGMFEAFKSEPNFRIHTLAAIFALILAAFLHFSIIEFAILVITISSVIILELINTLIEKIVDKISPNYSKTAKTIKDVSAAIVLISAFAAVLVGVLLYLPKILPLVSFSIR